MSLGWNERRLRLLNQLSRMGSQGRAEGEPLDRLSKTFYPVPEHLRMLDPEVVLVVGPRGSGKTEIFRATTDAGLARSIAGFAPSIKLPPPERSEWRKGYPLGTDGFESSGLKKFFSLHSDTDSLRDFWFAYLVRCLIDRLDSNARARLSTITRLQGGAAVENYKAWKQAGQEPLLALDRLDAELEKQDAYIFVGYDELDTLGGTSWELMIASIRGLVALWATYARRWRRIRAKLFLRTDLFERYATHGGADLAKLAAGRVELSWSERHLYGMLLKRIANTSDELLEYSLGSKASISWDNSGELGLIPHLRRWEDARPVLERIVGPYMGANFKKGLTYRWLIDHVRDGLGRAVPRPLVRLIEEAAHREEVAPKILKSPRLIHPTSLRHAIDRVSSEHVDHARDEWPWLERLRFRLAQQQVPWDKRRDVERLVDEALQYEGSPQLPTAPFEDARELLDYLVEVGVFRVRSDGRIDAPDLFLYGLGLKRKGGVRKR
jgi:hypothetical protein